METVLERYRERFPGSGVLYEKGRRIIGRRRSPVQGREPIPCLRRARRGRPQVGRRRQRDRGLHDGLRRPHLGSRKPQGGGGCHPPAGRRHQHGHRQPAGAALGRAREAAHTLRRAGQIRRLRDRGHAPRHSPIPRQDRERARSSSSESTSMAGTTTWLWTRA